MTLLFSLLLFFSVSFAENENLKQGNFYYSMRAKNSKNNMADSKNIKEAIKFYKLALDDSSSKQEAAWKLLRAYYFLGCFTMRDKKERKSHFERAKIEGEAFYKEFPKNVDIAYWFSSDLGLWVREVKSIKVITQGTLSEIRKIANMLITADKKDKKAVARGYQLLGKTHLEVPRIPGISWWIKKDSAEVYLKKSLEINPKDLTTTVFLAELYKKKDRKDDIKKLLLPLVNNKPRQEEYLEDERNYNKMRRLLE